LPVLRDQIRHYLAAQARMMNAAWVTGDRELAMATAQFLVDHQSEDRYSFLPAVVKVLLENDDRAAAKSAVAKFVRSSSKQSLVAWTVALVAAATEAGSSVERAIDQAVALNPHALKFLAEAAGDPWAWFGREEEPDSDMEGDQIACLHGATWAEVPGGRAMLLEDGRSYRKPWLKKQLWCTSTELGDSSWCGTSLS
jgi:hypothetical protein